MALVREAGAERDLGQAEPALCPQEVLCSFNPACDYKLVRRESGSSFKLPRKMIEAEVNNCRHSFQRRIAFKIFHNVLNDPAELVARKYTVRRGQLPVGTRDMTDQVNGQNIGE